MLSLAGEYQLAGSSIGNGLNDLLLNDEQLKDCIKRVGGMFFSFVEHITGAVLEFQTLHSS